MRKCLTSACAGSKTTQTDIITRGSLMRHTQFHKIRRLKTGTGQLEARSLQCTPNLASCRGFERRRASKHCVSNLLHCSQRCLVIHNSTYTIQCMLFISEYCLFNGLIQILFMIFMTETYIQMQSERFQADHYNLCVHFFLLLIFIFFII